jgi:D-alanyl-lipoteichoic acid acyltransferase DltB (MBOAT superfamily)
MISFNMDVYEALQESNSQSNADGILEEPSSIAISEGLPSENSAERHAAKCDICQKLPRFQSSEFLYEKLEVDSAKQGRSNSLSNTMQDLPSSILVSNSEIRNTVFICQLYRTLKAHSLSEYNFINFQVYVFYVPLYLSGPIMTFNDFMHQLRQPLLHVLPEYSAQSTALYFIRWLFALLLMEILSHFFYVVAIKETKAWTGFSTFEIFSLGYWNLKLVWLKVH